MSAEFDIIEDFFHWQQPSDTVRIGVGDDAAVLDLSTKLDQELVVSVDTLIDGVHFPKNTPPDAIGHKSLAVNLSDLAAMGAKPEWFTLAISLPESNRQWLQDFTQGLKRLAQQHGIALIGGDTTRGPLSITIQVMGFVPRHQAVLRSTANVGDKIYVSNTLGDAAIGLALIQQGEQQALISASAREALKRALNYPQPQNALAELVRHYASACLDISDGLLQDLGHILKGSQVGAQLNLVDIPLSEAALQLGQPKALPYALSGGDDYQLLFTISPEHEPLLLTHVAGMAERVSCIGHITSNTMKITDTFGIEMNREGYQHFYG